MIKKIIKKIMIKLSTPVIDKIINKIDKLEIPEYKRLIEQAYNAGYNYHQKMAKKDPELMAWIGREYYFDDKDII